MDNILEEIRKERERQDKKWGVQNHSPIVWDSILGEEAGEVSKAALESHFNHMGDNRLEDYREELIQTAAVCVAAIECLDRNELSVEENQTLLNELNKQETVSPSIKFKWKRLGEDDNWLEAETGQLYEVITDNGKMYIGYAMDWGFVPRYKDNEEDTLESNGEEIIYFREIE